MVIRIVGSLHLCALPNLGLGFYHQCASWFKRVAEALATMSMFQAKRKKVEERTKGS